MGAEADAVRIVFLGPPGSGKGTQAEHLAKELGVPAISTGDMLRAAVAEGSDLGKRVESVLAAGELVSDELMADLVRDRLAQQDAQGGFLLDGYPRTAPQADTLSQILSRAGVELDHVVMIDVPEDELVRRALDRGRDDDSEEVIRNRQSVYREQTEPLIEHYRRLGLLREVNGHRTIEAVRTAILEIVDPSKAEGA